MKASQPKSFWERPDWYENIQKYGSTSKPERIADTSETEETERLASAVRNLSESMAGAKATAESAGRAVESFTEGETEAAGGADRLRSMFAELSESLSGIREKFSGGVNTERFNSDMQDLIDGINQAKHTMAGMESGAKAFDSAAYEEAARGLAEASAKLGEYKSKITDARGQMSRLQSAAEKASAAMRKAAAGAKMFWSATAAVAKSARASLSKVGSMLPDIGRAFENAGKKIRMGFMLASLMALRRAVSAMFSEVHSAFDSLVEHSARMGTAFSQNINSLANDARWVGGSIVAAFEPVLNAVAPIIDALIAKLVTAINAVNQFFAALTGAKTWSKAVKGTAGYSSGMSKAASATKKAADAQKELNEQLAGFDKLNNLTTKKESDSSSGGNGGSGGSGGGGGIEYQPQEIDPRIMEWAEELKGWLDKIKGWFADIWDALKQAWERNGATTIQKAKDALAALGQLLADIANDFRDVFTGDIGAAFLDSVFNVLNMILDLVNAIATAADIAWRKNDNGKKMLESIFKMLTNILNLVSDIGESFVKAFNSDVGVSIFEHLYHIIGNCADIIGNLAGQFDECWKHAGLGDSIVMGIFKIVDSILGTIDSITKATAEWAKQLDFVPLLESINHLVEAVKPLVDAVGSVVQWLWKNVVLPFAKFLIEEVLPRVIDLVGNVADVLGSLWNALKPVRDALSWIWEHIVKPVLGGIGKGSRRCLTA